MRVLILRPKLDSEQTAKLLEMRGHGAIIAPLINIEPLNFCMNYRSETAATFATSANAFRYLPNNFPDVLKTLPCITVGTNTSEAAKKAGFSNVTAALGDAKSLVKMIASDIVSPSNLLYLTGQPRKPDLEKNLKLLNYNVISCENYEAVTVKHLPETAIKAVEQGVDVILHFSRRSAQIAMVLFEEANLMHKIQTVKHICLSENIAGALRNCQHVYVAPKPKQTAMLNLIDS